MSRVGFLFPRARRAIAVPCPTQPVSIRRAWGMLDRQSMMTSDPTHLDIAIRCIVGLAGLAFAIRQIRAFFAETPAPAETYETKESARRLAEEVRVRFSELEARHDASGRARESDRTMIRTEMADMRNEMKEDIRSVQDRLDAVAPQIAQFQKVVGDDIRTVHARIDNLPAQIVTLLRNTGAIQ